MLLSPMPKKKAQGNGNFNLCTEHSHKAVNQRRHMRERQAADWGGGRTPVAPHWNCLA